eukprot:scaffold299172_cov33-Tisochrysis_lutea.AAC.2
MDRREQQSPPQVLHVTRYLESLPPAAPVAILFTCAPILSTLRGHGKCGGCSELVGRARGADVIREERAVQGNDGQAGCGVRGRGARR